MNKQTKRRVVTVTEQDVQAAFDAFCTEAAIATGKNGGRARFKSFKVVDELMALMKEANDLFVEGELTLAFAKMGEASVWLRNAQRKYCANSIGNRFDLTATNHSSTAFFERLWDNLPALDEDLAASLRKKYVAFSEMARLVASSPAVDLDAASVRYWELYDAIEAAPVEQEARMQNRAERAAREADQAKRERIAARRLAEEERAEQARHDQAAADERRRQERGRRAATMAEQLAALA